MMDWALAFHARIHKFQPTTWIGHLLVAEAIWWITEPYPFAVTVACLIAQTVVFFLREWRDYEGHRRKGDRRWVWIWDGVADMVGPLTVVGAALGDFWVAHTIGFGLIAVGSVAWVGLGLHERKG